MQWFGDPNDPTEALAIAERFQGEYYNGGLSQFFANWEPADAALVPTALRVIGFPQGAQIIQRAIDAMGLPVDWQDIGHRALIDPTSPARPVLYSFCDEFDKGHEAFDKAIVDFEYQLAKTSGEEMFE